MDYEALVEDILNKFKRAGALAEVFLQRSDDLEIDVRNGKLENLKQSSPKGMGIRVFYKKRMSFVDSTDFSKGAIDSLVDKGLSLARMANEDEYNVLPRPLKVIHEPDVYDPEIKKIPMEKKIELAKEIEMKALSYHPLITKPEGCSYSNHEAGVIIGNTLGVFKTGSATYFRIRVGVVAEKGASQQPGEYETGNRYFSDLMGLDDIAENAGRRAVAMVGGEPVKSQKAAVVFDRLTGERLLDGIIGGLNGEQVELERSFLRGKVGQKIGSDLITIVDDGIMDRGASSRAVDSEGVPTQRRTIIENGVLKGYFYNTRAAARVDGKSTGNAQRFWYGASPGIGANNFYMRPGNASSDEIIKSTKKGLHVLQTIGFGVDSDSGGFSVGAAGVWIKDGKVVGPIQKVTIASHMLDMLRGIDAVAGDLIMDRGHTCPTFRVKEMTIGGI